MGINPHETNNKNVGCASDCEIMWKDFSMRACASELSILAHHFIYKYLPMGLLTLVACSTKLKYLSKLEKLSSYLLIIFCLHYTVYRQPLSIRIFINKKLSVNFRNCNFERHCFTVNKFVSYENWDVGHNSVNPHMHHIIWTTNWHIELIRSISE